MPNERGRPQLYCRPSHNVRACEKRREIETKQPSEKLFRLLREQLARLARYRATHNQLGPGMDEIRRSQGLPRKVGYQRVVDKVRELVVQLAPELAQDLAEPWRGTTTGIEANTAIEQAEESAPAGRRVRRR
jgi:hypothetical protein